jgi:3-hydroxybutyryl-CoA dehydratase
VSRVRAGDRLGPVTVGPVTITDIVRFAGASGDFNPLHHDPAVGDAAGLGGVIAMGQYQAALVAGVLSDAAGVENVRRYRVRFVRPVRPGDVIEIAGDATAGADGSVEVALSASVRGTEVLAADATIQNEGETS